jgi:outer membrane protein assembly factor BamB
VTVLSLVIVMAAAPAGAIDPSDRPAWAVRSRAPLVAFGTPTVLARPAGRRTTIVEAVRVAAGAVLRVRSRAVTTGAVRWTTDVGPFRKPFHATGWATIDEAGAVYALASLRKRGGGHRVLVVSLDPDGAVRWQTVIGGPSTHLIGDVALSPDSGRLYVGMTVGRPPDHVVVRALDAADGTHIWSGAYHGPGPRPDLIEVGDGALVATDVAVVAAVCGGCDRAQTDLGSATTVAFDAATGAVSWDGVSGRHGWQAAYADHRLAVTPDGSEVIAGGWSGPRPVAIAFGFPSGTALWRRRFRGHGAIQAAAVHPAGEVTLLAGNAPYEQMLVAAVDTGTGQILWRNRLRSWVGAPWIVDIELGPGGRDLYVAAAICGGPTFAEGLRCAIDVGLFRYDVETGRRELVGRYGPPHMNVPPDDLAIASGGRASVAGTWNATVWPPLRSAVATFDLRR